MQKNILRASWRPHSTVDEKGTFTRRGDVSEALSLPVVLSTAACPRIPRYVLLPLTDEYIRECFEGENVDATPGSKLDAHSMGGSGHFSPKSEAKEEDSVRKASERCAAPLLVIEPVERHSQGIRWWTFGPAIALALGDVLCVLIALLGIDFFGKSTPFPTIQIIFLMIYAIGTNISFVWSMGHPTLALTSATLAALSLNYCAVFLDNVNSLLLTRLAFVTAEGTLLHAMRTALVFDFCQVNDISKKISEEGISPDGDG